MGYYYLQKSKKEKRSLGKWSMILDHTIQVGRKKALAILRLPLDRMKKNKAISFQDVDVIHIEVKESWDGEVVCMILLEIFKRCGYPSQIISDNGGELRRGIREALEKTEPTIHVTYDLTHFLANLLKKRYEKSYAFVDILKRLGQSTKKMSPSKISYLVPPKLREKQRFHNLPRIAKWFERTLILLKAKRGEIKMPRPEKTKMKEVLSWILAFEDFLVQFYTEVNLVCEVQKILKNKGMTEKSYNKVCRLLEGVKDQKFKQPLLDFLKAELEFSKEIGIPILLTSDVIESLFGKYKTIARPHRLLEINRMILVLPCLCQNLTVSWVKKGFKKIKLRQVERWSKQNIEKTSLSKRNKITQQVKPFLKKPRIKKKKENKVIDLSKSNQEREPQNEVQPY